MVQPLRLFRIRESWSGNLRPTHVEINPHAASCSRHATRPFVLFLPYVPWGSRGTCQNLDDGTISRLTSAAPASILPASSIQRIDLDSSMASAARNEMKLLRRPHVPPSRYHNLCQEARSHRHGKHRSARGSKLSPAFSRTARFAVRMEGLHFLSGCGIRSADLPPRPRARL
jgi:hypothetical protein